MSSTRARRFYFTNERDSYANKIGRATDLGVITAVFFRERRERTEIVPPPRPRPLGSDSRDGERRSDAAKSRTQTGEPSARAESGASHRGRVIAPDNDEYAATGIGRSVNNDVWRVEMDLESQPAADVTIRYEFRDALVRLGVLPRTHPPLDPLRRRERARGFEDGSFSPEP
jgi:hypothetical protein